METSVLVAQLLAVVYIVIGLGLILNTSYYQKTFGDFFKSGATIYLGGILALVVGFFLIKFHNVWEQSWVVIITLLGWIAFLKGLFLLIFPKTIMKLPALTDGVSRLRRSCARVQAALVRNLLVPAFLRSFV